MSQHRRRQDPLPFELVDAVLAVVHDASDIATVQACALVCKGWSQVSRSYIFQKIKLTDGEALSAFIDLIDNDTAIGNIVVTLTVKTYRPADEKQVPTPSSWLVRVPAQLPSRLPRLQSIYFVDLHDYGEYMNHEFFIGLSAFTSVNKFSMRGCSINQRLILSLLTCLPNLRHLDIGRTLGMPYMLQEDTPQLYLPELISFNVDIGSAFPTLYNILLTWALSTPSKFSLRSFSVVVRMLDAGAVGDFLKEVGGRLEYLEMKFVPYVSADTEYDGELARFFF